jgi:hypothetical protein
MSGATTNGVEAVLRELYKKIVAYRLSQAEK